MNESRARHYVYLYRSLSGDGSPGAPKYVGYGTTLDRALHHAGDSHNPELKAWLARGRFHLTSAGPYRDAVEGKAVEAALISALSPPFNHAPGNGPKFVPVGVPPELGDRPSMRPLRLSEVGILTGGALLVRLASGDHLPDGRVKYDPGAPDDEVIVSNLEGKWRLGTRGVIDSWRSHPIDSPRVLIGVHGNVKHRFIVGATVIDQTRWADESLLVTEGEYTGCYWVPLVEPTDLDAHHLRGRRLEGVRFARQDWQHVIWVDGEGTLRHPL